MTLAPLLLPEGLRLTAEQFEAVCHANPNAVLELDASGRLIQMTPTGGETGARNSALLILLGLAIRTMAPPPQLFDSSTGFRLPDGSVLSPDASVVRLDRWQALSPEERRGFVPLCPDLVVELASPSDEGPRGLAALRRKMAIYQANGAQLGWLLIPEQRAVEVWPASGRGEPVRLEAATQLDARPLFPGLQREPCTPASYPAKATTRPLASDKLFYFLFQSQPDLILRWLRDLPEDAGGYSFSAPVLKEREYRLDQRLFWDTNPVL